MGDENRIARGVLIESLRFRTFCFYDRYLDVRNQYYRLNRDFVFLQRARVEEQSNIRCTISGLNLIDRSFGQHSPLTVRPDKKSEDDNSLRLGVFHF